MNCILKLKCTTNGKIHVYLYMYMHYINTDWVIIYFFMLLEKSIGFHSHFTRFHTYSTFYWSLFWPARLEVYESSTLINWRYHLFCKIASFHSSTLIKNVHGKITKYNIKLSVCRTSVTMLFPCPKIKDPKTSVSPPKSSTSHASIVINKFRTLRWCLSARFVSDNKFFSFSIVSLCTLLIENISIEIIHSI